MRIRVGAQEFDCLLRARAWQQAGELSAIDATIEVELLSVATPGRGLMGLIHGRLARASTSSPFVVPLETEQIVELVASADEAWRQDEVPAEHGVPRLRLPDARSRMKDCRVQSTSAPQYAGKARDLLESRFQLGSEPWMQDWPLEVCDRARIPEFCAFYEEVTDPLVRFDLMQLALFSYDAEPDKTPYSVWFVSTLRRDFALHGHTIREWAALDREADDPELRRNDPEFVHSISGLLRVIWETSLVPVEIELA